MTRTARRGPSAGADGGARIGELAPPAVGRTHHGEELRLEQLAGAPVLVMFYPFAFSRVCGSELAELQARRAELRRLGVRALAVSCDAIHSLRAYAEHLVAAAGSAGDVGDVGDAEDADDGAGPAAGDGLGVELVSDFWPHGRIAQDFGAFDAERGVATRTSYLLDAELVVRHIQHVPTHQARELDETLDVLARLSRIP
ncbi:redoxin domain-containing protein [Nesterenkonia sp. F]|uniref:redoxin domain-containing protein n=1 Tax=Nesterenkonia sp. F TaxID=795955 RepID=UPI000255D1C6|nr:redoxin domain-containing protein [Nesterenkonia sp. F]